MKPLILGLAGHSLTPDEAALFRAIDPAGYILFGHNISDPAQIRALTDSLRDLSGKRSLPILIDQEGGRVARLRPPHWPHFPAGEALAALYDKAPMSAMEAARSNGEAMGLMLADVGVTVNCAPVLDIRRDMTSPALGDRALGTRADMVAALGRAALDGLHSGGVVGVIKHLPGLGRADTDSHLVLPVVDASDEELAEDLAPFAALNRARIGMVGHIVYSAWDAAQPASLSPAVIARIIRERIGFAGLLISDDLHMEALTGTIAERALACLAAGCDLALACWVRGDEARALAEVLPDISAPAQMRLDNALSLIGTAPIKTLVKTVDSIASLIAKRDALLAYAV